MIVDTLQLKYDVELAEIKARHEARLWEEKRQIARGLKGEGVPIEIIAKTTKLPIVRN